MTLFHLVLGVAVVLLNAAAGVRLLLEKHTEGDAVLAGWAHAALGLQAASGFFLFTATEEGPGILHVILPIAALGGVIAARVMSDTSTSRAVGAASLVAAGTSVFAFVTGVLHG